MTTQLPLIFAMITLLHTCRKSIQIVIHYSVSKPQSKLIYVLSILSEPSRNLSAPLKVYFSGNTPLVNGLSITVQVFTSKPATAICRLGQTKTMPCKLLLTSVCELFSGLHSSCVCYFIRDLHTLVYQFSGHVQIFASCLTAEIGKHGIDNSE